MCRWLQFPDFRLALWWMPSNHKWPKDIRTLWRAVRTLSSTTSTRTGYTSLWLCLPLAAYFSSWPAAMLFEISRRLRSKLKLKHKMFRLKYFPFRETRSLWSFDAFSRAVNPHLFYLFHHRDWRHIVESAQAINTTNQNHSTNSGTSVSWTTKLWRIPERLFPELTARTYAGWEPIAKCVSVPSSVNSPAISTWMKELVLRDFGVFSTTGVLIAVSV